MRKYLKPRGQLDLKKWRNPVSLHLQFFLNNGTTYCRSPFKMAGLSACWPCGHQWRPGHTYWPIISSTLWTGELWPACLPTDQSATYNGRTATVVGWGRTEGKSGSTPRFVKPDFFLQSSKSNSAVCRTPRSWTFWRIFFVTSLTVSKLN